MKASACSLAIMLGLSLSSGMAASAADDKVVTGTIVEVSSPGSGMTVETAKKERYDIDRDLGQHYAAEAKVGAKVTIHYRVTLRGKAIATQIEKTGSGAQKKSTD